MSRTLILFLLLTIYSFAQNKEMATALSKGDYNQAIILGKQIIAAEPNDFETTLMLARAYNEKADFNNAMLYIQKSNALATADWQKRWVLIESTIAHFGMGNAIESKKQYDAAKQMHGTANASKKLSEIALRLGFDDLYANWKTRESKNIIFHFESTISDTDIEHIVLTRQKAFDDINGFFNATLPKKIDFFVWNQTDNYNPKLTAMLGFTKATLCISHNRMGQTPGHEIAHNISFWSNSEHITTKFINEGIGVCFDQQMADKLTIAKAAFRKQPADIKGKWQSEAKWDDGFLYPIGGAFVSYLIKYDKEKFMRLVSDQSYDNAAKIYGNIDDLIGEFVRMLKE